MTQSEIENQVVAIKHESFDFGRHHVFSAELDTSNLYTTIVMKVLERIAGEVVKEATKRYLDEHYAEIVSKLDAQALANMAVADAVSDISYTLKRNARRI